MVEIFYYLINVLLTPFLLVNLVYRCIIAKEDYKRIFERFGIASSKRPVGRLVWIHAASVGESMSVSSLVDRLDAAGYKILLTTYTTSSAKIIKSKYGKKVIHQFLPLENFFAIRLFLNYWKPDLAIFVESEFWPVIICQAARKTKIISLNTKVSDRSFRRWKKYRKFIQIILGKFHKFYPQNLQAKSRLQIMDIESIEDGGNLKYSSKPLTVNKDLKEELIRQIGSRSVIMAFSTHQGEEEKIIEVYKSVQKIKNDLLLLIVPRHVERSKNIENIILKNGLSYAIRSKGSRIEKNTNIYLADTIGELGTFFDVVKINIVGGSLNSKIGGHNPIEPAIMRSMCLMGPENYGFKEITKDFIANNAMVRFRDKKTLEEELIKLLDNPELVKKYANNSYELVRSMANSQKKLFEKIIGDIE